jgi:hypothetical protein
MAHVGPSPSRSGVSWGVIVAYSGRVRARDCRAERRGGWCVSASRSLGAFASRLGARGGRRGVIQRIQIEQEAEAMLERARVWG